MGVLKREDITAVFENEFPGCKKIVKAGSPDPCGYEPRQGVHIPLLEYKSVSGKTISEIYQKRMPKTFKYHLGGFTCSDFARYFHGIISEEQHDNKTEKPFAIAECWSRTHAFNAIVTNGGRILLFEPQSGKFLTKEKIGAGKKDMYEVRFVKF